MKKLVFVSIIAAGLGFTGLAQAGSSMHASNTLQVDAATERSLVNVCKALKSNNRLKLIRAVKQSGIKYDVLAKGLVCNGMDAVDFAQYHSASDTALHLAKRGGMKVDGLLAKQ